MSVLLVTDATLTANKHDTAHHGKSIANAQSVECWSAQRKCLGWKIQTATNGASFKVIAPQVDQQSTGIDNISQDGKLAEELFLVDSRNHCLRGWKIHWYS
jgi:hypothetical protein